MEERVERMKNILEREEREKKKSIIIKEMRETREIREAVKKLGNEIEMKIDNKEVRKIRRKIRTRWKKRGEMVKLRLEENKWKIMEGEKES